MHRSIATLVASVATACVSPSPSPSPGAILAALDAHTVSGFLDRLAARQLGPSPFLVTGYWSDGQFGHSCPPPNDPDAVLQIPCRLGEFGLTEHEEPFGWLEDGMLRQATGPRVQPYPAPYTWVVLAEPGNRSPPPPHPIVVVGHVADPLALRCPQDAQAACLQRLVIDGVVEIDGQRVPPVVSAPDGLPADRRGVMLAALDAVPGGILLGAYRKAEEGPVGDAVLTTMDPGVWIARLLTPPDADGRVHLEIVVLRDGSSEVVERVRLGE